MAGTVVCTRSRLLSLPMLSALANVFAPLASNYVLNLEPNLSIGYYQCHPNRHGGGWVENYFSQIHESFLVGLSPEELKLLWSKLQ
eukprot:1905230-Amphidinium_carterae.1